MIMKNYMADKLSNKVYHLHKALEQAQSIIKVLETENNNLKEVTKYLEKKNGTGRRIKIQVWGVDKTILKSTIRIQRRIEPVA